MATPKAIVLRTAGTNCDRETVFALETAGFDVEAVHVNRLMAEPKRLGDYQFLVLPGGFSYGDDVSAGKILAGQLLHRLAEPLSVFLEAGNLVLGICNGFQVAIKSGLLPWGRVRPDEAGRDVTLAWNDSGRFEERWVHLAAGEGPCVFFPPGERLALPVAHGEGKFVPADEGVLSRLRDGGQLALRYVDAEGRTGGYPVNPNGSAGHVAGICDPTGRVLGLMPHPERFIDPTHHPQWTRTRPQRCDGTVIFEQAFACLR